jgi:hypothetical protein
MPRHIASQSRQNPQEHGLSPLDGVSGGTDAEGASLVVLQEPVQLGNDEIRKCEAIVPPSGTSAAAPPDI